MIDVVFAFLNDNAGLGLIGLAFAIGFLYVTKVQKTECGLKENHMQSQILNQKRQTVWVMDTLFKMAQKHGVQDVAPPPKEED